MAHLTLIIGNKNYSSWSMRAWVLLRQAGIAFDEVRIPLFEAGYKVRILQYSPAGFVPALLIDGTPVWDTLAIAEAVAELYPAKHLWPADLGARRVGRSICAEMHSGFVALRSAMPMNIRGSQPGKGMSPEVRQDIDRIVAVWQSCREQFGRGGDLLFGDFTIADAFYAPVVMRFTTYAVELPPPARRYADAVRELPAVAEWMAAARLETEFIAEAEPYAETNGKA